MKKRICLLLALGLLCAGAALADTSITTDGGTGSTTVTYTVPEAQTGYTVIIPASVAIPQGDTGHQYYHRRRNRRNHADLHRAGARVELHRHHPC